MRILFVEKNATVADLLVPGLERKGYQVVVAATQRIATSRGRSFSPDLLIVDLASFGAKGYQVLNAVRAQLGSVSTILLLEEGHSSPVGMADAFMTPPFTSRKLLYRVRKVAQDVAHRQIKAGKLVFDPDTRILHRDHEVLQLRPKEAKLLAFFMRNPGRVISRQEIMKEVWETDYLEDTRTLSVHVRWLRVKIEDDPKSRASCARCVAWAIALRCPREVRQSPPL